MTARKGLGPNVVTAIAVAGLLAAMVFLMVGTTDRDAKIDRLSAGNDALRVQVQEQGEIPVAPPAETVTGETGAEGLQGPRGFTGDRGDAGVIGIAGIPGQTGSPGVDGAGGADGADGADSVTPGPVGATGADSTTPGPAGPAGEPPASWTFTDRSGAAYDCNRTDPFDPTSPAYECTAQPKE